MNPGLNSGMSPPRKKGGRKIWLLLVLIIAGGYWYMNYGSNEKPAASKASPPVKVTLAAAERREVPLALSLAGNVIPYETVSVKARLDSVITQVAFKDGDRVEAGQVLFRLDDRALKAQLGQQKATLADLKLQYDRAELLIVNQAIAQAALDSAKAAYEAQRAVVESTEVLLSYATITAPIDGRAGTINVTLGNNVKANDTVPLVTINQVSPIRVQFAIPERHYEQVRAAMVASVPVHASRQNAVEKPEGKLEYIDNTIDPATGTFIARAVFSNENEALWPGMFTSVVMELAREEGLTVPSVAIQGDAGKNFVFRAAEGKAVKTPVVVARIAGELAIISEGLSEGEEVLVDGMLRVADGSPIDVPAASEEKAATAP